MGAEQRQGDGEHATDLSLGDSDRFRIVRWLGTGGMGVVYEAIDLERNVHVALKTLRATNAQSLYRFKHEFRALAQIVHPRLVPLFELVAAADSERWFFTMELVEDGENLMTWIRGPRAQPDHDSSLARANTVAPPCSAGDSTATWMAPTVAGLKATVPEGNLPRSDRVPAEKRHRSESAGAGAPPDYDRLRAAFAQLAEGVRVLHAAGRLHRDLKPENVFVKRATGDVVLLDFGLVAALDAPPTGGEVLSARPPASAPDVRTPNQARASSDSHAYYATHAGSIAGTIPYMAPEQAMGEPLTMATDWYAVGAMLYEALTGKLPVEGSDVEIIMEKQRAEPVPPAVRVAGTPPDLDRLCMELLRRNPAERPLGQEVVARLGGSVEDAEAGEAAQQAIFIGRTQQLRTLRQAFESSAQAPAIAHVRAAEVSGAGKSALLACFLGELTQRPDTLVLTGRCYEQEFIPFKAVDSLMDALTHYLLQCPEAVVSSLLPADAHLLSRVFPVIGRVLPASAAGAEVTDLQTVRRRAFAAVRELLGNLARRVRLVLFIDDLQWGDVDSSALLAEVLRAPEAPRLLLVLSYRSEQSGDNECLRAMAQASKVACAPDREFVLDVGALGANDARELSSTLLGSDCAPDTLDWVVQQSAGSAFLIHELARHLRGGGARASADGLGLDDILWKRVLALPAESRALLSVVAAAGRPVRLLHAQRAAEIDALGPRVVASLRAERLARTDGVGLLTEIATFHDRVRESIMARTARSDTARRSAALARALVEAGDGDTETLAALFEQAGDPGRASGYYAAAVRRAVAALAVDRAELLAGKAIALARSDEELAVAYEAAIDFYTDMSRFPEAYAITRKGVGALGIALPAKFVPPLFIADFLAAQVKLAGKKPASLLDLPTMPNGRLRLAVRLANAGAKAAFQVRPELCVAVCTKIVRLCLAHGNSPDCAIGYMVFGAIFQGGIMGRYRVGYELGQLALALVDKYENERQRAEVCFVVGYFGTSWLRPATEAEALWRTAFEAGRDSGDLFHMGCAAAGRMMSLQMRGAPLVEIEREACALSALLARNGLREALGVVAAARQAARDLRGVTRSAGSWHDGDYDEAAECRAWSSFGARHFAHYCHLARAQSFYLWGQLDGAARALRAAKRLAAESKGMLHSAEQVFLEALVVAARGAEQPAHERLRARVGLGRAVRKLDGWAKHCPENFQHRAELVRAEADRAAGRERAALAGYARAADSARRFGHVHLQGLSHLLAARLHALRGAASERDRQLELARASFHRWGATALAASVSAFW